jgi:hypothetical protein
MRILAPKTAKCGESSDGTAEESRFFEERKFYSIRGVAEDPQ